MDKLRARLDQKDLRRLAAERKKSGAATGERINSPLAKYDSQGNLSCVICRSSVKSSTLWKVHINSKQHKQNVEEAKGLKEQIMATAKDLAKQPKKIKETSVSSSGSVTSTGSNTFKMPKSILKTVEGETPAKKLKQNDDDGIVVGKENNSPPKDEKKSSSIDTQINKTTNKSKEEDEERNVLLPEQFFDAPTSGKAVQEAQDEEWERFQREIKDETAASNEIIAGEHHESTVDRHLIEIDEQLHHWSKVRSFEMKIENLQEKRNNRLRHKSKTLNNNNNNNNSRSAVQDMEELMDVDKKEDEDEDKDDGEDEDDDVDALEDFLDWRCKSLKKRIS